MTFASNLPVPPKSETKIAGTFAIAKKSINYIREMEKEKAKSYVTPEWTHKKETF